MKDEDIAVIMSNLGSVRGRLQAEARMREKDFDLEIDQLERSCLVCSIVPDGEGLEPRLCC